MERRKKVNHLLSNGASLMKVREKNACVIGYETQEKLEKHMQKCHTWCYKDEKWLLVQSNSQEGTEHIESCLKCKGMHQEPVSILLILYFIYSNTILILYLL